MNVLHSEILNILHSNGKDYWTVAELLVAIPKRRGDSEIPEPTKRDIQRATLALCEDGKATRRGTGSCMEPLIYSAAIPDPIDLDGSLVLFWNWLVSLRYRVIFGLSFLIGLPISWSAYCIMEALR
jgi:hypothetical protein